MDDGPFFWAHNVVYDVYGRHIGLAAFGLYCALARFAEHDTQQCWPSMARLARDFDVSIKTVRAHLQMLVDYGLVTRQEQSGASSRFTMLRASEAPQALEDDAADAGQLPVIRKNFISVGPDACQSSLDIS